MLAQHIKYSSSLNRLPNQNDSVVAQTNDPPQTSDLCRVCSRYEVSAGSSMFVTIGARYRRLKGRGWNAGSGVEVDDEKEVVKTEGGCFGAITIMPGLFA